MCSTTVRTHVPVYSNCKGNVRVLVQLGSSINTLKVFSSPPGRIMGVVRYALQLFWLLLVYVVPPPVNSAQPTLYEILGVARDVGTKELKRAYHRLALELHPDKHAKTGDGTTDEEREIEEELVRRFIEVVAAYEVLSDPKRRKDYDLHGDDSLRSNRGGGRHGRGVQKKQYADDNFHYFARFNGGVFEFHYTGSKRKVMGDINVPYYMSLEDLFTTPRMVNVTVQRQRLCPHCHGTKASKEELIETCPVCQGNGHALHLAEKNKDWEAGGCDGSEDDFDGEWEDGQASHGDDEDWDGHTCREHHPAPGNLDRTTFQQVVNSTCTFCGGTGKIVPENATCQYCGGVGTVIEPRTYNLMVTHAGQSFKFPDGGQAVGYKTGNVHITITAHPHHRFQIKGSDLIYKARVDLVEALVGFEKYVKHLDGRHIPIVHDVVTFQGYKHVVKGEGLLRVREEPTVMVSGETSDEEKKVGANETRGDLVVEFDVVYPTMMTAAQREALRTVMDEDDIDVLEDVIELATATQSAKDWQVEKSFSCMSNSRSHCTFDLVFWISNGQAPCSF